LMPTATTSQILGNSEMFEPVTSNIYVRRTLAGEFVCVNSHLIRHLIELGLWNKEVKQKIIAANGSVQYIKEIPADVRRLYRTVWEIPQQSIIDMSADRAPFIDQTQSLNNFDENISREKLSAYHFYTWKKG